MCKCSLILLGCLIELTASAQLPSIAQAIYNEAYANDSLIVKFAAERGAQVLPSFDGETFYIQWTPRGSDPSKIPMIVSLHGKKGYAFYEFKNWYTIAQQYGCGIIALQWYRGNTTSNPNDYFGLNPLYDHIDYSLQKLSYPTGKA